VAAVADATQATVPIMTSSAAPMAQGPLAQDQRCSLADVTIRPYHIAVTDQRRRAARRDLDQELT